MIERLAKSYAAMTCTASGDRATGRALLLNAQPALRKLSPLPVNQLCGVPRAAKFRPSCS